MQRSVKTALQTLFAFAAFTLGAPPPASANVPDWLFQTTWCSDAGNFTFLKGKTPDILEMRYFQPVSEETKLHTAKVESPTRIVWVTSDAPDAHFVLDPARRSISLIAYKSRYDLTACSPKPRTPSGG